MKSKIALELDRQERPGIFLRESLKPHWNRTWRGELRFEDGDADYRLKIDSHYTLSKNDKSFARKGQWLRILHLLAAARSASEEPEPVHKETLYEGTWRNIEDKVLQVRDDPGRGIHQAMNSVDKEINKLRDKLGDERNEAESDDGTQRDIWRVIGSEPYLGYVFRLKPEFIPHDAESDERQGPRTREATPPEAANAFAAEIDVYAGLWHSYHLTRDEDREFWLYKRIIFPQSDPSDSRRLITTASMMPKRGRDEKETRAFKGSNKYQFEAELIGRHLLIKTKRLAGLPDASIEIFRDPYMLSRALCGMRISTHAWDATPVMTISIMSREPLPCTKPHKGQWPAPGTPISDPTIMSALRARWNMWAFEENCDRLGTEIIGDIPFVRQLERHAVTNKQIWIASHNLQNVGERTSVYSRIVRDIIVDNANRGVHYTYVYPDSVEEDKVRELRKCFSPRREKQLHLIPVSDGEFQEISNLEAHFISLNPVNQIGRLNLEADVYMQLPVATVEKGWLKLDGVSATRVLKAMEKVIFPLGSHKKIKSSSAAQLQRDSFSSQ